MNLKNKKVAVLGLGIEGKDLVKYLDKQKAIVEVLDEKKRNELDTSGLPENIKYITGKNYLSKLERYNAIFRSPGVYRFKKELERAEKSGAAISSGIKLFFNLCPAKIIGVTGTKGKGTTATLIYQILKNDRKDVYLAGNIGKPILELLPKLYKKSVVILELSSFQLIDIKKSPHIAVVLNITSDHLDWHKDLKEYINAKRNIVLHQTRQDIAVINSDFKISRDFADLTKGKVYYFSKSSRKNGCYVEKDRIVLNTDKDKVSIGGVEKLQLRGKHNWENVTAAICAARLAGTRTGSIKKAVFSFKGLEHRLEYLGKVNNIGFYNDSFATSPQPTIAAIKSFYEPITLILGGYDKGLEYEDLVKEIVKSKNVNRIILIGDLKKKLRELLLKFNYNGKMLDMEKKEMVEIVKKAFEVTPKRGVVLLSTAAASFDMFKNYKERGKEFKSSVAQLDNLRL